MNYRAAYIRCDIFVGVSSTEYWAQCLYWSGFVDKSLISNTVTFGTRTVGELKLRVLDAGPKDVLIEFPEGCGPRYKRLIKSDVILELSK